MRDPRRPATFATLVLLSFVVARFLDVGAHEVLGHGLFAVVLGGSFYGVYVSPVSGFAFVLQPTTAPGLTMALEALAGILVEILLSVVVLAAYPRLGSFVARLVALLAAQVLIFYPLAYLVMPAFVPGYGDPGEAVAALEAPHLPFAFLVVGLLWSVAVLYFLSTEVLSLVARGATFWRRSLYLVIFWLLPLPLGVFPNVAQALSAPVAAVVFLILFMLVLGILASSRRMRTRASSHPLGVPMGRIVPLAVAFLVVVPVWVGVFGLTSETAHGVLFSEPPLAAEGFWANPQAVNLRTEVTEAGDVRLELRMKGAPNLVSPLEREAFATFETRADFAYWAELAGGIAANAMNWTVWNVTSTSIDPTGTAWFPGGALRNPRVVLLALAVPGNASRYLNVSTEGSRTFLTLTVFDPLRHLTALTCAGCYLDEVNLTWAQGGNRYRLENATFDAGDPDRLEGTDAGTGLGYVSFRNREAARAPKTYTLRLEILP